MSDRVWIRVEKNDKIINNITYDFSGGLENALGLCFSDALNAHDLPTPIITTQKAMHFVKFGTVKFLSNDFVENVTFTTLTLEVLREKKPPHKRHPLDEA